MSSIDLRQWLIYSVLVMPLFVLSGVPWSTERAAVLAEVESADSPRVDSCDSRRLTVVERFCWKELAEIEAGAECRFTLLNEGREPIRLKAGLQNRLVLTYVPSEVAPGEVVFVTAACQGPSRAGVRPWIGRSDLFTSDPNSPIVSLYAMEGQPIAQVRN